MAQLDPLDIARFWSHVTVLRHDQCWHWTGSTDECGYGAFKTADGKESAHRIAYLISFGELPEGAIVRHKCDQPPCCNPNHLESGTHIDNVRDRVVRDRSAKGERNGRARLTEDDVRTIRASSESKVQLAARYEVTEGNIDAIRSRRSWIHVKDAPTDDGLISIDDAAAKYGIDVRRLRGYIWRNNLLDPIGDIEAGVVYVGWRLERLATSSLGVS